MTNGRTKAGQLQLSTDREGFDPKGSTCCLLTVLLMTGISIAVKCTLVQEGCRLKWSQYMKPPDTSYVTLLRPVQAAEVTNEEDVEDGQCMGPRTSTYKAG